MQLNTIVRRVAGCALVLGVAFILAARPARADVSVEGGAIVTGSTAGAAGALSLGLLKLPLIPLAGELTFAAPFKGGYATTFNARLSFAGSGVGAGAGFGTLGAVHRTGTLYDALLAHAIAPHTALEARMYFGGSRPSALFAGRFAFRSDHLAPPEQGTKPSAADWLGPCSPMIRGI